jgi:hypothetical protein
MLVVDIKARWPNGIQATVETEGAFDEWCIEPVELHRVYPAVTDVTEANGTGERAVSGGDAALVSARGAGWTRVRSHR